MYDNCMGYLELEGLHSSVRNQCKLKVMSQSLSDRFRRDFVLHFLSLVLHWLIDCIILLYASLVGTSHFFSVYQLPFT